MQHDSTINIAWQLAMAMKKKRKYLPFSCISSFMTKENLVLLSQHNMGESVLRSVLNKLDIKDHAYLWNAILPTIGIIPDSWRYLVFADCCRFFRSPISVVPDVDIRLLVDLAPFRQLYCRRRMPGFTELKWLDFKGMPKCSTIMYKSIREDDVSTFMLCVPMELPEIPPVMITDILDNGALKIFSALLEYDDICKFKMTLKEILYYAVSHLDDLHGMAIINMVENKQPGIVAAIVDFLGNDLLWYSMHNYHIPWFMPECGLTSRLKTFGCNPLRINHLNLSFHHICNSLPLQLRKNLLSGIYNTVTCLESYRLIEKLYGKHIKDAVDKLKIVSNMKENGSLQRNIHEERNNKKQRRH